MFSNSISALLGDRSDVLRPRNGRITYSFVRGENKLSNAAQRNVRVIFRDFLEPYLNVKFTAVRTGGDITYQLTDRRGEYAYEQNHEVYLSRRNDNAATDLGFRRGIGSYGFFALLHETLHALGLKHPGNYNGDGAGTGPFLPYDIDNTTNTVMSYNNAGANPSTPMPYDLSALQDVYRAAPINASNTHYRFTSVHSYSDGKRLWGNRFSPSKLTLQDRSGYDILDFSRLGPNGGGYVFDTRTGGIITTEQSLERKAYSPRDAKNRFAPVETTTGVGTRIMFDSRIEHVIGSRSNDRIVVGDFTRMIAGGRGNDSIIGGSNANNIQGNEGSDIIDGGAGNDKIVGGNGDRVETDPGGNDTLFGGAGNDRLYGEGGRDCLYGEADDDILYGGSGNDRLYGSSVDFSGDRDQLFGGPGRDRFVLGEQGVVFYQGSGYALIKDWESRQDKIQLGSRSDRYSFGTTQFSGSSALDTTIYYNNNLIGVIEDFSDIQGRDIAFG